MRRENESINELAGLLIENLQDIQINDYAFLVAAKLNRRDEEYIYGPRDNIIKLNNNFLFHFRN